MNFALGVEMTLLKSILAVVKLAVGVLTSSGYLMRLPPTVSWVRWVSSFCGRMFTQILP